MKPMSVRLQLTLWNVGVLALILVALGGALRFAVQETLTSSIDRNLTKFASIIQNAVNENPDFPYGDDHPQPPPGDDHGPPPDDGRFQGPVGGKSQSSDRPHDGNDGGRGRPGPDGGPSNDPRGGRDRGRPWRRGGFRALRALGAFNDFNPVLFDMTGAPVHRNGPLSGTLANSAGFHRAVKGEIVFAEAPVDHQISRLIYYPLRRGGKVIAVVQVRRSLVDARAQVHVLERVLLTLSPFALLIAGLGGAFLTNRALKPVRDIAQAAERVEAESLSERLPVTGGGEFTQLSATFNAMLERLQIAFKKMEETNEQQRRFVADASHELRTPLSIIKANTSLALMGDRTAPEYKKTLTAVDSAADRTTRIVQDLLLLARADADQVDYPREPIDIEPVLRKAGEGIRGDASPCLTFSIPQPSALVHGNADALVRLFTNLIDNAARHTPADGDIRVTVAAKGRDVTVIVADTGEGIAPEHLPHVADRFYRIDTARSRARGGTGLGLAICDTIVREHHGSMEIDSILGQGTTVTITLPAAKQ